MNIQNVIYKEFSLKLSALPNDKYDENPTFDRNI